MNTQHRTVLAISGFDPCGDAGLIKDTRVLNTLNCHTLGIITCQTIQNHSSVSKCIASDVHFVEQQLDDLISHYTIDAIKLGVIPNIDLISIIAHKISELKANNPDIPVVLDPVIKSSSGYTFCDTNTMYVLLKQLLPLTTIITPNLEEAQLLSSENNPQDMANRLIAYGCQSVFITSEQSTDYQLTHRLYSDNLIKTINCQRLSKDFHGSGCVLSSSIAFYLADGNQLIDASRKAISFTYDYLSKI